MVDGDVVKFLRHKKSMVEDESVQLTERLYCQANQLFRHLLRESACIDCAISYQAFPGFGV